MKMRVATPFLYIFVHVCTFLYIFVHFVHFVHSCTFCTILYIPVHFWKKPFYEAGFELLLAKDEPDVFGHVCGQLLQKWPKSCMKVAK